MKKLSSPIHLIAQEAGRAASRPYAGKSWNDEQSHWWHVLLSVGLVLFALVACAPSTSTVQVTTTRPATATPSPLPSPTLPPAVYAPVLVIKGFGCPDDLAQDAAGNIIFSDQGNGTVNRIGASSVIATVARGLNEPEGVIMLPDGTLIVGEQGDNGQHVDQIDQFAPGSAQSSVLVAWHNATNLPGVDSLSLDPHSGDLLVADSPNGTILRVSRDGKQITTLARGFVRPVDAIGDAQGNIYVADEYGNAVARIAPDGTVTRLRQLADPDDLAFDLDGTLLVSVLGDNTVVRLDPSTGQQLGVLGRNLFEPQGLIVDAHGNLFVSEETANAIIELVRGSTTPGPNLPGLSGRACR